MTKLACLAALAVLSLCAQGPGRGIPDLTDRQTAALTQMNTDLAPLTQALNAARTALIPAPFTDSASIPAKAEAVRGTELALANARADAFTRIQASDAKFAPNQVVALAAGGGAGRGGRGGAGTGAGGRGNLIPGIRTAQTNVLIQMTTGVAPLTAALNAARAALTAAAYAEPRNDADIRAKADAVKTAELAVANFRANLFTKLQGSADKLNPEQVEAFVGIGGSFSGLNFSQPDPLNFADHQGYVSLFDGVSLSGWDGNPKFWRVEDGAIVGESTPQNPSGNTYLVYRRMEARDFTLKFEIKIEGAGGSGLQYRSKTGLPWLSGTPNNASGGGVNLNWMMTGPQADFWPTNGADTYSGQFYSENTPMRILAWRGQVVEGYGLGAKRLMGNIGDRAALGALVKKNDWNEYTIIARGGTCMHILNGQLMAVMVDDDPDSSNNQSGLFGIEIEAITKVSVRNIWVNKLN